MKIIERISQSIQLKTVAGNEKENKEQVNTIVSELEKLGFDVKVEGESQHFQPAIIAYRPAINSGKTIAMYNHYDVEPIHKKSWEFSPWVLTQQDKRLYGRGIADNKAVLWTRISVLERMLASSSDCPAILWLIQGEEEVGPEVAYQPFKEAIQKYQPSIFLEETGYHKEGEQLFLVFPKTRRNLDFAKQIASEIEAVSYKIEFRHLNKSYQKNPCPFISNIPEGGFYFAFGPNDSHCRIHSNNESLDTLKLEEYAKQFELFLYSQQ